MWLTDYAEAIKGMLGALDDCCFTSVATSWDGELFIFKTDLDWYYVYFRKTGRIEKRFSDTWQYPEHVVVILEGG